MNTNQPSGPLFNWTQGIYALHAFSLLSGILGAATIVGAFALAVWAGRSPSVLSWGLTGFLTGAAVATKAYSVIAILPIAILLWPAFAALESGRLLRADFLSCSHPGVKLRG